MSEHAPIGIPRVMGLKKKKGKEGGRKDLKYFTINADH